MGQQISFNDKFGNTCSTAYIKILRIEMFCSMSGNLQYEVMAGIFKDKSARDASKARLSEVLMSVSSASEKSREDLYDDLKAELVSQGIVASEEDVTDIDPDA